MDLLDMLSNTYILAGTAGFTLSAAINTIGHLSDFKHQGKYAAYATLGGGLIGGAVPHIYQDLPAQEMLLHGGLALGTAYLGYQVVDKGVKFIVNRFGPKE